MKEKQTMSNEQLQAALSSQRSSIAIFKILTYGFAVAAMALFAFGLIPLAIPVLVLAFVFGYQMSKRTQTVKKLLSENIVSGVLNEVFENVEYSPFGRISDEQVKSAGMVFPFAYDSIRGSDHVKGVYRGLNVELSDVELYHVESHYDEEMQQWRDDEQKVFAGQWLICDFGKQLSGEVHLSASNRALRRQHKADSVEMENAAFNDRFLVTSASAQEAYYLLTPHMMEYILSAAGQSGGEVYMAFLRGGRLHIAVKTGRDFFELGKSSADVERLRQKFLGELHWFTGIIDALRLETTLYRKEPGCAANPVARE